MDFLYNFFIGIVPFIIVLSVLVYVHELGHYWAARINGVKIEVFSIGFGKEIFGWTNKQGTRWKIACLPFGGYVQMHNETLVSNKDPQQALNDEKSLVSKSVWQKIFVAAAGPVANFIFAIAVFLAINITIGEKISIKSVIITGVTPASPANEVGLQANDKIIAMNDQVTNDLRKLPQIISNNMGEEIKLTILRDNAEQVFFVTPNSKKEIGITMQAEYVRKKLNIFSGLKSAYLFSYNFSGQILHSLYLLIKGEFSAKSLAGPLGIAKMATQFAQQGIVELLFFSALLSINLGLINLLPLPALDGGHIILYIIEAIKRKPLSVKFQEIFNKIGLIFIVSLAFFVTWQDLLKLKISQLFLKLFN